MADSEKGKSTLNWERFGLNSEERKATSSASKSGVTEDASTTVGNPNVKELFDEDQVSLIVLTSKRLRIARSDRLEINDRIVKLSISCFEIY